MKIRSLVALGIVLGVAASMVWFGEPPSRQTSPEADAPPERVICASPSAAEIVYALNEGDRVVGVSDFTAYPPEARRVANIGGYINPNFERILALRPGLIITQGKSESLTAFCQREGIELLRIDMTDIETILADIQAVGEVLGATQAAKQKVQEIRTQLSRIENQAPDEDDPLSVFLCLGRRGSSLTNLMTTGGDTFLSEIVEIAGGKNIYQDLKDQYPDVSSESLLRRAPEVIVEFRIEAPLDDSPPKTREQLLEEWRAMEGLPAVQAERIYLVTEDYFLIPGPRIVQAAGRMVDLLHAQPPQP